MPLAPIDLSVQLQGQSMRKEEMDSDQRRCSKIFAKEVKPEPSSEEEGEMTFIPGRTSCIVHRYQG